MKKFTVAIIACLAALGVSLASIPYALTANAETPTHEHTLTYFEVTSPTHKAEGYYAHYYCETCDIYFNTAGQQCTKNSLTILALGHLGAEKVAAKEAIACESGNIQYWYCSTCDGKFAGTAARAKEYTDEETVIPATHTLSYVEEVAATTQTEGVKAHWICSDCERLFSDSEGKTQVSKESLAIEKLPLVEGDSSSDEGEASEETSLDSSDEGISASEEQTSASGGCKSSVGGAAFISALLGAVAICVKKRKNNE